MNDFFNELPAPALALVAEFAYGETIKQTEDRYRRLLRNRRHTEADIQANVKYWRDDNYNPDSYLRRGQIIGYEKYLTSGFTINQPERFGQNVFQALPKDTLRHIGDFAEPEKKTREEMLQEIRPEIVRETKMYSNSFRHTPYYRQNPEKLYKWERDTIEKATERKIVELNKRKDPHVGYVLENYLSSGLTTEEAKELRSRKIKEGKKTKEQKEMMKADDEELAPSKKSDA